jgi:hypothetical protein
MVIVNREGITYLKVNSEYLTKSIDYLSRNRIKGIVINRAHGYLLNEVEFLKNCPWIEHVMIAGHTPITKLHGLYNLASLRGLNLASLKCDLDFSKLLDLEFLSLTPSNKLINIESLINLKELIIWGANNKDVQWIKSMRSIERLSFYAGGVQSLEGIEEMESLRWLICGRLTKLKSLGFKLNNNNIQSVFLESCRNIVDLKSLLKLSDLHALSLLNCMPIVSSINYLKKLNALKKLSIKATVVEDGDMSVFDSIDNFYFETKKHYNRDYKTRRMEQLLGRK